MNWVWTIPNLDPYVAYLIAEITRWIGANALFLTLTTNALTAAKIWAIRSGRAKDDKILTLALSFVSFNWFRSLTGQGTAPVQQPKPEAVEGPKPEGQSENG